MVDENVAMKQELFILRQSINSKDKPEQPKVAQPGTAPAKTKNTPKKDISSSSVPVSSNSPAKNLLKKQKNALLIGDSISGNLETDVIEKAMNARVKTVKAYLSIFDDTGNITKASAP